MTFAAQLAALCRDQPTRSKWVFVPSHAVGHTLGDRLVLDGVDWANVRYVTPFDIALRMGAPFLVEREIDPSEEGLGPALIMRLLLDLPLTHTYFRKLADQPQMAQALWSTIRELRMAGVRSTDLRSTAFRSGPKFEELHALLQAYEDFLIRSKLGDRKTVFREAMRHPRWCPIKDEDLWTFLPGVIWSELERELFNLLPGEFLVPQSLDLPRVSVPRRLKQIAVEREAPSPAARLSFLLAPDQAGKPDPPAATRLSMFTAGGCEAEVEEVFRRILAAGATLDDVEIACSSPGYSTLIWEKACRYDWPVTLAMGLPVTLTRPGRALLSFSEWIEDEFAAGRLRRLLQSADIHIDDITPGRAARLLVQARAAWGRETYRRSLGRVARSARTAADRDDMPDDEREGLRRRADEADALATWIDGLIHLVPEKDADGAIDLQALVAGARTFVTDYAAKMSALDAAAATVLAGALDELRALGDFRCDVTRALRFLRERVESLTVGADRPRPGHLHVSLLSRAAVAHRRHLFVVGLEEGRVFPAAFEDPVLLDEEREAISPALGRSTDRTDEAVYAVVSRLAEASAAPDVQVCLSYSCRDLRQFRETYASWLMLQAYRIMSGRPDAPYKEMHDALRPPASVVPGTADAALDEGRWWLHGVTRAGDKAGRRAVLRRYPSLDAGVRALDARASERFTEFDGHVPEAGPVLDPAGQVVSPTRLEGAAKCGFRFFLERGLHVRAIESGERSRDIWLDPLIRGSLLHELYATFYRRCRDARRRPSVGEDREWFLAEGRRRLDDLKADMPPPSPDVEARETASLLEDLDLFVQFESGRDPDRTPIGFEVAFGLAGQDDTPAEPLASPEPIDIKAGDLTFRLTGRVDRVDRIDGGPDGPAYQILDYKTGGFWRDDWEGTFAGGRMLQHALYSLAVAELLRRAGTPGKVTGAEYFFSSAKGRLHPKVIPAPPLADVAAVLADLREVIISGLFVHAPEDRECRFCDYGHACGRMAHQQATAKAADPALEPWRRLVAHE